MSAGAADTDAIQRDFPFLTKERLGTLLTTGAREYYCEDCKSRVTVSISGSRVFGHRRDCPNMETTENGINRGDA